MTSVQQANLLAYDQISDYDQSEREIAMSGGKSKPTAGKGKGKGRGS